MKTVVKGAPLYVNIFKIDVPAKKKTINNYEGAHFLVKLRALGRWYISVFLRFLC